MPQNPTVCGYVSAAKKIEIEMRNILPQNPIIPGGRGFDHRKGTIIRSRKGEREDSYLASQTFASSHSANRVFVRTIHRTLVKIPSGGYFADIRNISAISLSRFREILAAWEIHAIFHIGLTSTSGNSLSSCAGLTELACTCGPCKSIYPCRPRTRRCYFLQVQQVRASSVKWTVSLPLTLSLFILK